MQPVLTPLQAESSGSGLKLRLLLYQDGRVHDAPGGRIKARNAQSNQTQPGLHTNTHSKQNCI